MAINEKEFSEFLNRLYHSNMINDDDAFVSSLESKTSKYKESAGDLVDPIVSTLIQIANLLYSNGRFDGALVAYQKALELRERFCPLLSAETAHLFVLVGDSYSCKNDMARALEHFQIAHGIYVSIYGGDHAITVAVDRKVVATKKINDELSKARMPIVVDSEIPMATELSTKRRFKCLPC